MDKHRLQCLLDAETDAWSRKPYARLVEELTDVVAYGRGTEANSDFHQFEVQMIEHKSDYVHVIVSIDDGTLLRSLHPVSRSFIVHRDGRVER